MLLLLILLAAGLSWLPYLTDRRGVLRAVLAAECILSALGAVLLLLSAVTAHSLLTDPALAEGSRAWARDVYTLWIRMSGLLTGVVGGCVLLAALIRHPMRRVRSAVTAAVCAILLLVGWAYLGMSVSDTVDLTLPLTLWTVGCACLVRLGAAVDAVCLSKTSSRRKNLPKKNKRL